MFKWIWLDSGRERGIRTPGGITLAGFQDRCIQPLCHLPTKKCIVKIGGDTRIWTGDRSFAGSCLTAWPYRRSVVKSLILLIVVVVPGAGFEPAHPNGRGILSPLRLPVSPSGQRFAILLKNNGAGNEVRTRDPDLGKVVLYHWAIPAFKKELKVYQFFLVK